MFLWLNLVHFTSVAATRQSAVTFDSASELLFISYFYYKLNLVMARKNIKHKNEKFFIVILFVRVYYKKAV